MTSRLNLVGGSSPTLGQTHKGTDAYKAFMKLEPTGASILEGAAGTKSEMFRPMVVCPECQGTKYFVEGEDEFPCQRCRATGEIVKGSRAEIDVCNCIDDTAWGFSEGGL